MFDWRRSHHPHRLLFGCVFVHVGMSLRNSCLLLSLSPSPSLPLNASRNPILSYLVRVSRPWAGLSLAAGFFRLLRQWLYPTRLSRLRFRRRFLAFLSATNRILLGHFPCACLTSPPKWKRVHLVGRQAHQEGLNWASFDRIRVRERGPSLVIAGRLILTGGIRSHPSYHI